MKRLFLLLILLTGCQKGNINETLNKMVELKNYEVKTEIINEVNEEYTTIVNNEEEQITIEYNGNTIYGVDDTYYVEVDGVWQNPDLGLRTLDFNLLKNFEYVEENDVFKTEIFSDYPEYYLNKTYYKASDLEKMIIEIQFDKYIEVIKTTVVTNYGNAIITETYSNYNSNDEFKLPAEIIFGDNGVIDDANVSTFKTEMNLVVNGFMTLCINNELSSLLNNGNEKLTSICLESNLDTEQFNEVFDIGDITISGTVFIKDNEIVNGIFVKGNYVISVTDKVVNAPIKD